VADRGEKPADIPAEQPTKFNLALARADEVIE
jgi:hypothetical protein